MNFKCLFLVLASFVLSMLSFAEAQQPTKVLLIGYLSNTDPTSESARAETNSARSARAWPHRRTEHRHRVPIC